jgi:membrane-associated protease RseP (regulator of RpoE activity)
MHLLRWIRRRPSGMPWQDFIWRMRIGCAVTIAIILFSTILHR